MIDYGQLSHQLAIYEPVNYQEKNDLTQILRLMAQYDDLLWRTNSLFHFTTSGFVVNDAQTKVLMVYHHIYQSWSWTGGHADGATDLLLKAIDETKEETGLKKVLPLAKQLAAVDILPVQGHWKNGHYISAHLHLNCAYLLRADEQNLLHHCPAENGAAAWLAIEQLEQLVGEPFMLLVYRKLIERLSP